MTSTHSEGLPELFSLARLKLHLLKNLLTGVRNFVKTLPYGQPAELMAMLDYQQNCLNNVKHIDALYNKIFSGLPVGAAAGGDADGGGLPADRELQAVLTEQRNVIRRISEENTAAKDEISRLSSVCIRDIMEVQKKKSSYIKQSTGALLPGSLLNYSEESHRRRKGK